MKNTIVDTVYSKIRDAIVTGEIDSKQLILEQGIADQYGISKVTARETLQRLCHEKYLKSYPRKGYLVNEITPQQCFQIQQVRYQIEALSLRLVIKHSTEQELEGLKDILQQQGNGTDPYDTINTKFHMRLAELSRNQYIYDTLYTYMGSISRYALTGAISYKNFTDTHYHMDIVKALQERNPQAALHYLRLDIQLSEEDI